MEGPHVSKLNAQARLSFVPMPQTGKVLATIAFFQFSRKTLPSFFYFHFKFSLNSYTGFCIFGKKIGS
jgi:hypothetical protein